MSARSRLAEADQRIAPSAPPALLWPSLALNSAGIAGGISAVPLPAPIVVAGVEWTPADAEPWALSIGYSLAVEMAEATS